MRTERTAVYKPETTGSLMTKEFIAIRETTTIEQAINYLRENVRKKRNIHYVYIIDQNDGLTGVLSIRELLAAKGNYPISEIMNKEIDCFPTNLDQEEAAKVFQDTDLVTIPVINGGDQLVGVIHVEDILDVMQQRTFIKWPLSRRT